IAAQGCDAGCIKDLAPAALAGHWQEAGGFLIELYKQWPLLLAAEARADIATRRDQAIGALARRLERNPPAGLVIAAGSTGSIPATAELLGVIARLPNGALVLPGLDQALDEKGWNDLDPGHPQYGLKQLLERVGVARADVRDWHGTAPNRAREQLLSETLRPAPTTDVWRALVEKRSDLMVGLQGLALVEAADPAEEALAIALALRQALETENRSAALVTPDRGLARRVAAELRRWDIVIDDSAGRPLAHTSAGSFLCLVAEAAEARFAPVPLLALLKHPFARAGGDAAAFRTMARALDLALRGPRPDPGLAGVTAQLEKKPERPRSAAAEQAHRALQAWWHGLAALLAPLEIKLAAAHAELTDLTAAHLVAAEALACDDAANCLLWSNLDGEAASHFTAKLLEAAALLPAVETSSYAPLFRRLATAVAVRAPYGQHPRLAILGTQEARLQRFDLTILGGLNEGVWPESLDADPWFSRSMRDTLGLERPERAIGKSAHDFAMLAAGPQVLLTRALKAEGAPTVPSRWLQRLEQLVAGFHQHLPREQRRLAQLARPTTPYAELAEQLLAVSRAEPLPRPHPTPPVGARPRRLSVTEIETWLRDPYAIYARHVLGLAPLDALNEAVGPSARGTLLHSAVEEFVRRFPAALPTDAESRLIAIAARLFDEANIPKAAQAVWLPRFADAARGFIALERERRNEIATPHVELKGKLTFDAPGGEFTLTGRADRIDALAGGGSAIVDYKSGAVPSRKQVEKLIAPQLPLEAAMLAEDGFGIGALVADTLIYISLADGAKASDPTLIPEGATLGAEALARLKQRVAHFDEQRTPYYPRVMPFRAGSVGDYDHLARVREWSATAEEA
ncbi:MAG: double-strand break repair protein AddB, partial [Alphaproteobacteria bacterium]|nr:double-strand break repair protein AddB [Alphaproteobacteria bacterium]